MCVSVCLYKISASTFRSQRLHVRKYGLELKSLINFCKIKLSNELLINKDRLIRERSRHR